MPRTALAMLMLALLPHGESSAQAPGEPGSPPPAPAARKKAPPTDRGNLGIQVQPIRAGEEEEGIRVSYVFPGSAALAMGFKAGDEVLELNGIRVKDRKFFTGELARENIGAKVSIKVRRGAEVIDLRGPMGSYLKMRQAYLEHCRAELVGKPFATAAELVWPDGADGLAAMKGKIGLVVSFDGCQDCVQGKWLKVRDMSERLARINEGGKHLGFAGIFSNLNASFAANTTAREQVLARHPGKMPVAVARYPGDVVPFDMGARDALIQDHGLALIDPEGKVIHLELGTLDLENPGAAFFRSFQDAWNRFGPPPKAADSKDAPKEAPKGN